MNKIVKNRINKGYKAALFARGIPAFALILILVGAPNIASAYMSFYQPAPFSGTQTDYSSYGQYNNNQNNQGANNYGNQPNNGNSSPYINYITPSATTAGAGGAVITITGNGFVPASMAQFDGTNYPTTYVSPSELRINLSSQAVANSGKYYVSVINPGGGFSNPVLFTIKNPAPVGSFNQYPNTSGPYSYNNSNYGASAGTAYQNTYGGYNGASNADTTGESYSDLTAGAIYGSTGFFPSGLLQWILFIILVFAIIFVWRRFFGSTAKYHSTPLKHA